MFGEGRINEAGKGHCYVCACVATAQVGIVKWKGNVDWSVSLKETRDKKELYNLLMLQRQI